MSQQQELSPSVLQAAARVAFFNSAAKQRVVSCIVKSKGAQAAQVSMQQAAQAAFLPARDVLLLLKQDPCFKIVQAAGAGGGGAAQYCVELNVSALLRRAKGATSTGVLTEELPPPKGFVQGKHPIRPGQPDCKHYVKFGECAYNERCVFNHPGKPSPPQHKQQQQHKPDQQPPAAPKAPAPPPQIPAWGGAGVRQAAVGGAEVADVGQNSSTAVPPTLTTPVSTVSSSSSPRNGVPNTPSSLPDTADRQQAKDQQQPTPQQQQQQQQQPAQPAQLQQQQQPVPEQQQQPAQPAQAQRLPPGFGLQHFQSRPCQLMLLRGFCPMGDKCPYDHTRVTGVSSQPAAGQQPVPHISTAAAAANGSGTQGESPLAAAAEPVTPEAAAAAAAAVPAAPAPAGAGPAADPAEQAASSSSSNSSTKAGGQRSWRQLLVPEAAQQQEQPPPPPPQQQQQQHVEHASQSEPAVSAGAGAEGGEQLGKLLGWTEDGLPQLRGVANCQFFMGTGSCKFKERCVYHHPAGADHPQCILRGQLPTRFNANNKAPYARLVSHLHRLWDYDSCVEAQLKVWLAKHLLAKNNPECHMWSASASKTAVYHVGRGFWWQPMGPYTCTMAEAGELLHELWRSQPDAASQEPFPYKKKLRELLADDPYFSVVADSKNSSLHWVKLELHKIKGMLNF